MGNDERKWTPGPWVVVDSRELPGGDVRSGSSEGPLVADVWSSDNTDARRVANAHLIAAAPEMYEAPRELVSEASSVKSATCRHLRARSALAKADGKGAP